MLIAMHVLLGSASFGSAAGRYWERVRDPATRNEGGNETSGDILQTSATLVDDPSSGVLVLSSFDSSLRTRPRSLCPS
jgi:hypothetical protein